MFDFVIVGGGVYGAAVAWHLGSSGAQVCLLDERDLATRASGGPGRRGVRANGRDVRELPLMAAAYELWPTLHERLEAPRFYERCGQLLLAETDVDLARAQAMLWMQRARGIPTEWLDADALREYEPGVTESARGALFCPLDGVADHTATTLAYARAAERVGVTVRRFTRVDELNVENGRCTGVTTASGERIAARRGVLVLANAKVAALVSPWVELPVWNECFQVLVSEPMAHVPFRHLTGHLSRTISLKPDGEDRVMISGGWRGIWDGTREEGETTVAAVAGNVADAVAVYPALEGLQVSVADASHQETLSVDDIPIVDCVPGVGNCWYAAGWCGHGWAIAPVIAEYLSGWALSGTPPAQLEPFSLRRFTG
ncbi:MAG: FAD-binding oxidoreductase [Pseudomonadota bacterium]